MALTTRPFGRTGLEITTVGAGTWAMGGSGWAFSWGDQDDDGVDRRDPAGASRPA